MAVSGDYGKPRPALVIESSAVRDLASVTLLPITSDCRETHDLRIAIQPGALTGSIVPSEIMVDKATTVPRAKIGQRIGRADQAVMARVNETLTTFRFEP